MRKLLRRPATLDHEVRDVEVASILARREARHTRKRAEDALSVVAADYRAMDEALKR